MISDKDNKKNKKLTKKIDTTNDWEKNLTTFSYDDHEP